LDFCERTKYVLADSVKELMQTMPLDKITVKEIVANCGTTRQTFYRNFKDKYDLVIWYFDKIIQKTIRKMGVSLTMEEALVTKFRLMIQDRDFITSAFSSSDYNNLLDYDQKCIFEFYKDIVSRKTELTEELIFLLDFYCKGSMGLTAEWAKDGMKMAPEEMAALLIEAIPQKLEQYMSDLSEYHQA
jgi:AcrR family transcriptional regulator